MNRNQGMLTGASSDSQIRTGNNRSATVWMGTNVVVESFVALFIALYVVRDAPFLFAAIYNFVGFLMFLLVLRWRNKSLLTSASIKVALSPGGKWLHHNISMIPPIISAILTFPLFVLATRYIDIVAVTVIYEIWPLFMVLMASRLFRREGRYRKLSSGTIFLFLMAFAGLGFVTSSQVEVFSIDNDGAWIIAIGVGFAFASAFMNALGPSFGLRHSITIHQALPRSLGQDVSEFSAVLLSLAVRRLLASSISLVIALLLGEQLNTDILTAGVLVGILVVGIGNIAHNLANIKTTHLGINALGYTRPLLAIGWLFGASYLGIVATPYIAYEGYFVLGASAIIIANILVNFEASIRTAYKALVVGLWISGLIIYLGDDISIPNYAEVVVFVATMFILLISFRTERLVRRTKEEEVLTLDLATRIQSFFKDKSLCAQAMNALEEIDTHKTRKALQDAYRSLQKLIQQHEDNGSTQAISAEVHNLVHSKQQGRGWGEFIALWFIGGVLITVLLFFGMSSSMDDPLTEWGEWLMGMVSFVIASTVLFLLFNIHDLQKDRTNPIIQKNEVVFRDVEGRQFERVISIVMGLSIVVAFGVLFYMKWVSGA